MATTYKDAGVDVNRGYDAVARIKPHARRTFGADAPYGLGGFGGMLAVPKEYLAGEPVIVAGTDGVGTKLKIAFELDKHDTVGIDAVAMSVNDVICQGAKPLMFLDYIATSRIEPDVIEQIVKGVADGCVMAGCALSGGETAEMPDIYAQGEYDLAGFCVGVADRAKLIAGESAGAGCALVGLASSGVHSNGFSLLRKLFPSEREALLKHDDMLGCTLGEELLRPTRIYVKTVLALLEKFDIQGIAHITGGGFIENIPRILPEGARAKIDLKSFETPPVFQLVRELSGLGDGELFSTFNMGIGMVLAVDSSKADALAREAEALGERAYIIGEIVNGARGVELCG